VQLNNSFLRDFCINDSAYNGGYGSPAACDASVKLSDQPSAYVLFKSLVSALLSIGCALGAMILAPPVADKLGRCRTISLGAFISLVGLAFTVSAHSRAALLAGRAVEGFGLGVVAFACPIYIAEIAPPAHRGRMGSLMQMACVLGLAVALALSLTPLGWRLVLGATAIPAVLLLCGTWLIPDSAPLALARHQRWEAAATRAAAAEATVALAQAAVDAEASAAAATAATVAAVATGEAWQAGGVKGLSTSTDAFGTGADNTAAAGVGGINFGECDQAAVVDRALRQAAGARRDAAKAAVARAKQGLEPIHPNVAQRVQQQR